MYHPSFSHLTYLATFLLLAAQSVLANSPALEVRFLDIGQGDSILMKTPSGQGWLMDGGPRRKDVTATIVAAMEDLALEELEGVVISHPHMDHFGGLIRLLDQVKIKAIYYGIDIQATTYSRFREKVHAKGIPYRKAQEGSMNWDPALEVEVLHARRQHELDQQIFKQVQLFGRSEAEIGEVLLHGCSVASPFGIDLNDYSVVVRVGYGGTRLLITGDATEHVEDRIMHSGAEYSADILKVAHHGSRYSSQLEFIQGVGPQEAVIQSKAGNSYGHPHRPTLRRLLGQGVEIHRNDESGTVALTIEADGSYQLRGQ